MKFLVLGRQAIHHPYTTEKHIVISIHDPNSPKVRMVADTNRLDVLTLSFHDWDCEQLRIIAKKTQDFIFFSAEMAKQILKFVDKYSGKVNLIVCQCEAGISRSAGVAVGLSKIFSQDDKYFFEKYMPNSLVYGQIIRAWSIQASLREDVVRRLFSYKLNEIKN